MPHAEDHAATTETRAASRERLEAALAERAVDLGSPGRDPVYGWGLIRSAPPCVGQATR